MVYDEHEDNPEPLASNPIWQQENVKLRSVGIDIGSSGTQIVFSDLKLHRSGAGLATRFVVAERRLVFQSPVVFTPYRQDGPIDAVAIGAIVDDAYAAGRVKPGEIDTGAVILTGEALRRENAEAIAHVIAQRAGDFVCAAAGHHLEAALAAYGSGAAQTSARIGRRILNLDVGGGTTKLSLLADGKVLATAALSIGGRLVAVDADGRVVRLEDAGREHARRAGVRLQLGGRVSGNDLDAVAAAMADVLTAAVTPGADPANLPYLTEPIRSLADVAGVVLSGGVAEYVYGNEDRDFGDLGRRLGAAIAKRLANGSIRWPLLPAAAVIRATALGASAFSVQLSGTTCYLQDAATLLPRRNLPVLRPDYQLADDIDEEAVAAAITRHMQVFGADGPDGELVLALRWTGPLSYRRLLAFARAIVTGLRPRVDAGRCVMLAVDADIASSLGAVLREDCGITQEILVIDGLRLLDFDYIDLGRPLVPAGVVPVTIKSLAF
ncbi:MAG: ethanolamine ammonia-lyase reactivating factor EutA [Actinobacteria bacterium]|nr:ethanolamine ammonia-lyase reactivating factor EutA [Actinomycetota bacterium]